MLKRLNLRKSRILNPCGRAVHCYAPQTLQGKEIVAFIVKDADDIVSCKEYTVEELEE